MTSEKPYVKGQKAELCGHFLPDAMHLRDERRDDGFVSVYHCANCGRYDVPLDVEAMSPEFSEPLLRDGKVVYVEEKDLKDTREKVLDVALGRRGGMGSWLASA
jgi:hypothetical protein